MTHEPAASSRGYFTTSYAFGNGTTSTLALQIWKALSDHLLAHQAPLSAEAVAEKVGITVEQVEAIFRQSYYQRYYGFRRFDTLEEWSEWAKSTGVLFDPERHQAEPEAASEPIDEDLDDLDDLDEELDEDE